MITDSKPEYVFIRLSILGLRLIAPLSIAFVAWGAYNGHIPRPTWLFCYAAVESAFYLFVYLPRSFLLQRLVPEDTSEFGKSERESLFNKCLHEYRTSTYPAGWFLEAEVYRENVREWLLWALFSRTPDLALPEWEEEIDSYIERIESSVGKTYERGRNKTNSIRIAFDTVAMVHRPLVWYLIVSAVDTYSSIYLLCIGFRHYTPWFTGLKAFPPRPLTVFSRTAATSSFPYWYRPHRSETKHPVVFVHGIGIGLLPYLPLLRELDSDVGFVLIELLPISMRMTSAAFPSRPDLLEAIETTLSSLPYFDRYVLAAHSYGTAVAAHILRHGTAAQVQSVVLMDPIPILLHLPDVAYNFLYRSPRGANEWQLWYFASRDADVARTLFREFYWRDCVLWKDDLEKLGRDVAVVLCEKDQIVASRHVWDYLTESTDLQIGNADWQAGHLKVLWYDKLDHAQVFDTKDRRKRLVELIDNYCVR